MLTCPRESGEGLELTEASNWNSQETENWIRENWNAARSIAASTALTTYGYQRTSRAALAAGSAPAKLEPAAEVD